MSEDILNEIQEIIIELNYTRMIATEKAQLLEQARITARAGLQNLEETFIDQKSALEQTCAKLKSDNNHQKINYRLDLKRLREQYFNCLMNKH